MSLTVSESSTAIGLVLPSSGAVASAAVASGAAKAVMPAARPTAATIRRAEIMLSATARRPGRTRAPPPAHPSGGAPAALAEPAGAEESRRWDPSRPAPHRVAALEGGHHGHCGKHQL